MLTRFFLFWKWQYVPLFLHHMCEIRCFLKTNHSIWRTGLNTSDMLKSDHAREYLAKDCLILDNNKSWTYWRKNALSKGSIKCAATILAQYQVNQRHLLHRRLSYSVVCYTWSCWSLASKHKVFASLRLCRTPRQQLRGDALSVSFPSSSWRWTIKFRWPGPGVYNGVDIYAWNVKVTTT